MNSSAGRERGGVARLQTQKSYDTRSSRGRAARMETEGSPNTVSVPVPESDTITVLDSIQEVVDLTCDGAQAVVDLTQSDSLLLVEDAQTFVLSSDEDERPQENAQRASISISCPICLDSYWEIVRRRRSVVSTCCGHVFCSSCLHKAVKLRRECPTCREKLNHSQYHPIFI